jgi:hypothetical protein
VLSSASVAAGAAGHGLVHTVSSPTSGTPNTLTSQQASMTPSQSAVASGPLVSPTQSSSTPGPGSFFGADSLSSSGDTKVVLAASLSSSQQQSPTAAPVSPHLQQNGFANSGMLIHDITYSNTYCGMYLLLLAFEGHIIWASHTFFRALLKTLIIS